MSQDDDHDVAPDDKRASHAEGEVQSEGPGESEDTKRGGGFRMSGSFSRSLLPNIDNNFASFVAPLQEQMRSLTPDFNFLVSGAFAPVHEQLREQLASIAPRFQESSLPPLDLPGLHASVLNPGIQEMFKRISEHQAKVMEGLRKSLGPLFDPQALRGLKSSLLPPNLIELLDEISASQVNGFVEQEGIPLYLVPRGRTALRLLRAKDRAGRRQVLSECYRSLIEDCAVVLERADHEAVRDERDFALDGLGAMRNGHTKSAQAMFTVTLDTLIYRFYPDRKARRVITNRKKGADIPHEIDKMGVRDALVWLPIWNAHEEFWKHKGDKVPRYYSRHASVHGVSSRQFSKRNCIQVLMLVTSLIGHADQMAREPG